MVTELDRVIAQAYASQGKQEDVNQVYLMLLRSSLFVPVQKERVEGDEEPFRPLFANVDDRYFMLVFDTLDRLKGWAQDQMDQMDYVELGGKDLIAGLNEGVFLCLNVGAEYYKEFSPEEVMHLKKIVGRIEQMKE